MKKITQLLFLFFFIPITFSQIVVHTEDFEGPDLVGYAVGNGITNTDYTVPLGGTSSDYIKRGLVGSFAFDPLSGTTGNFIGLEDIDGAGLGYNAHSYIELDPINILGRSNLTIDISVGFPETAPNRYESDDFLIVDYSIDGGAYTKVLAFYGGNDAVAGMTRDTNLNGVIDGGESTVVNNVMTDFTSLSIATTGTSIEIRVRFNSPDSHEEMAFDNIILKSSTAVSVPRVWTGVTSESWTTPTNWNPAIVPTTTDDVSIPSGLSRYPTASSAVTVNSVTIESGASLIAESTFSGTITYNRTIDFVSGNLKGWYLMASPVVGQAYNDAYATTNGLATSGTNRGLATYTTSSDSWDYLQNTDSNAGTFNLGIGYSMKKGTSTGAVSFTGTLNTDNAGVDVTLSTAGNRFNLLGNPYTSYINSATFLNSEPSVSETKTIWVWNQTLSTDGAYEVKTLSPAFIVAPGQGFFVKANVGGGAFNLAESNQSHTGNPFQRNSSVPEIKLLITDGEINQYGIIYYLENATTGFDVGYDGELFGGTANPFAIYTHLVSDSQGKNYQIQSLPNTNYENMVIPVGVHAEAGKEITISTETLHLPTELKVFLEDKEANIFTRLDEANTEYTLTLSETLNGIGRFYIHTSASALSVHDAVLNTVSVYKSDASTLRIVGLPQGNTSIKIYNVLGKELVNNTFEVNGIKNMFLPKLATGMYIVEIQTEIGTLNKKIVLE